MTRTDERAGFFRPHVTPYKRAKPHKSRVVSLLSVFLACLLAINFIRERVVDLILLPSCRETFSSKLKSCHARLIRRQIVPFPRCNRRGSNPTRIERARRESVSLRY